MDDVIWIDLLDPRVEELTDALESSVHASVLARLLVPPRHDDDPRPRLEAQGLQLFGVLVVPVISQPGGPVVYEEIDVVATTTRLVTVRKTPPGCEPVAFDDVRNAALAEKASVGMCLYRLFDEVAERYLDLVDTFDGEVEELEDMIQE